MFRLRRPFLRRLAVLRLAPFRPRPTPPTPATTSAVPHPHAPRPGRHTVTVLLNVTGGPRGQRLHICGYEQGHDLAEATRPGNETLLLAVDAGHLQHAADLVYVIGNGAGTDALGQGWPGDLRSVSIGDVLRITGPHGATIHFAVAAEDFIPVPAPRRPLVPLVGSNATARNHR